MRKDAINYTIRVVIQRILGLLFFLLGAWWVMPWHAWVYFGASFVITAISLGIMLRVNPETLAQRGKLGSDTPKWDKILLIPYWLLHFYVVYFIAGLEIRDVAPHDPLFWIGMVLIVISAVVTMAALIANTYLESTARIQKDRGQTVIRTGVYSIVRHPTYAAVVLSCLGLGLIFATPLVRVTALVIVAIIIVRTRLEDQMLQDNLEGYTEYSIETKYRLIPFVW